MALPDAAQQTPLEQLTEMNEQVGKTRRRKAKPAKDPSTKVERFMRAQLRSLVRAIEKEIRKEVVPVIEGTEEQYRQTTDSAYTRDGWAERIIAAINSIANRYTGPQSVFRGQYERLAQRTVSMAEAESTEAFVKSVNKSVGVDLNPILDQEGISDYLEVATQGNIELISSVPDEYLNRVKSAVWGGVRSGYAPKKIREDIRNATGVTENQAKRIARDQSAKLTSEITERRQSQAGVKYYRVSTAGDNRVTGKPGGKYPNAKISCWGIANKRTKYGVGVYRWDEGASWGGQTGLHPGRHHIQCFPGSECLTLIPGINRLYRRLYTGSLVRVETVAGGSVVTTPNHPILTSRGWVPAYLLDVGDEVIRINSDCEPVASGDTDKVEPKFHEVFGALSVLFGTVSSYTGGGDFHDDGIENEGVDIVDINGVLSVERQTCGLQSGFEFGLAVAITDCLGFVPSERSGDFFFMRHFSAPDSLVSAFYSLHALLFGHLRHADLVRRTAVTLRDSIPPKSTLNTSSSEPVSAGESENGLPVQEVSDERFLVAILRVMGGAIVSHQFNASQLEPFAESLHVAPEHTSNFRQVISSVVEADSVSDFFGSESCHVYNLETKLGWYNVNQYTARNCRCTATPVFEFELPKDKQK